MAETAIIKLTNGLTPEAIIDSIHDAQTAREASDNMEKLKKLLEIADQFGRYACEYCLKEAQMYVRIAEIRGAEDNLTPAKCRLVKWIRAKSAEELDAILEECAEGRRIMSIHNKETRVEKNDRVTIIGEFKRISDLMLEEYRTHGRTTVAPSRYFEEWRATTPPDKDTAKAYTEKTRDAILGAGGVGIADGVGTYVNPKSKNRGEIAAAIGARLRSISDDMKAIIRICRASGYAIPINGVAILRKQLDEMEAAC